MVTVFFRIIKYGIQNFARNGLLSVATIAVMVIALSVFLGLNLFGYMIQQSLSAVKDKIDISVYFKTNVSEDDILRVKRSLEGLSEVKQVDYVSRDNALDIFKSKHHNDTTIDQAIAELGYNPLSASLNVKAYDTKQYSTISEYLGNDSLKNMIEKMTYAQNQQVIDKMSLIMGTVEKSGAAMIIILSLIAGLVVFNTIRLAIYSNREEIGIMRLVGASNAFIRGPYLFTGLLYGIIAAGVSILILLPVVIFIDPYLNVFVPTINIRGYFVSQLPIISLYQLGLGVLLGIFSSYVAMRKHLRV